MLPELGTQIDKLTRRLRFVRDLEVFDGPILSEYHAEGGGTYLEKWCARSGELVRSLIVRTEQRATAEYLGGRISMRTLLIDTSDGIGFIVDRSPAGIHRIAMVNVASLPENYLPSVTAMHDESLRPNWEREPQNFLVGEEWDAGLLAKIERLYIQTFAMSFLATPGTGRRLPDEVFKYRYDRGFPVARAFEKMRGSVPRVDRARSVGVSAQSPGVLTIDAPAATAAVVMGGIRRLRHAASAYQELYRWSRLKPEDMESMPVEASEDVHRVCVLLGLATEALISGWAPKVHPTEYDRKQVFAAGKLTAAYYRKLLKLVRAESGIEYLGGTSAASLVGADGAALADLEVSDEPEDDDYF